MTAVMSYFRGQNQYRQYLGVATFAGGLLIIPLSASVVQLTVWSLLGLTLVSIGLYDLYMSSFYRVIRPVGVMTIGVGIMLVALGVVELWELFVLWPMAFILFGTLSLLSGILAEWHKSHRQTNV